MKLKDSYILREIAGETIVVSQGASAADLTRIISLNSTAKLLWESMAERGEFSVENVANVLISTFGIDESMATADAEKWCSSLRACAVIDD